MEKKINVLGLTAHKMIRLSELINQANEKQLKFFLTEIKRELEKRNAIKLRIKMKKGKRIFDDREPEINQPEIDGGLII